MRTKFIEELHKVDRPGIDALIECMETGGFFEAPCSGKYHLCRPQGLLEHSLNVLEYTRKLNAAWGSFDDETIIVVSLLHDLGKMGDHGKANYVPKYLKSGERAATPYETNKELVYLDHEVRSVMIAERFIPLTEEEETAILFHNGLYGSFAYSIKGKETPLYMLLHFSDMWCSRVIEEGKDD